MAFGWQEELPIECPTRHRGKSAGEIPLMPLASWISKECRLDPDTIPLVRNDKFEPIWAEHERSVIAKLSSAH